MKEFFDQLYSKHHTTKNRYNYLFCQGDRIPWLQKWIGQGKKVLDLGCRDGALTQSFAYGNEVIGVDVDRKALSLIEKRLGIKTYWLDLNQDFPFEENSFDVVVSCEILEHLMFPGEILRKIRKVLKKDGLSIGSVPNAFRMRNRWRFLFGKEFDKDPTHLRHFSYQSLERLLLEQFEEAEIVCLKGKILPFLEVSEKTPERINRLFAKDLLWCAR